MKAVRIDSTGLDAYLDLKQAIGLQRRQLKDLRKWLKDIEKGKEIPLFSDEERASLTKSVEVITKEERKVRNRAYHEEKKKNPKVSKVEFKKEWLAKLRLKEEERQQILKEKSHFFEKQPSEDRITKRIDHWERELKESEKKYNKEVGDQLSGDSQESKALASCKKRVLSRVDPRIVVCWCKLV